jgi:hypothetical protein
MRTWCSQVGAECAVDTVPAQVSGIGWVVFLESLHDPNGAVHRKWVTKDETMGLTAPRSTHPRLHPGCSSPAYRGVTSTVPWLTRAGTLDVPRQPLGGPAIVPRVTPDGTARDPRARADCPSVDPQLHPRVRAAAHQLVGRAENQSRSVASESCSSEHADRRRPRTGVPDFLVCF